MDHVKLPISKSIANRILLLQAIHGDPLMRVSSDMPDDVLVLHDALEQLQTFKQGAAQTPNKGAAPNSKQAPLVLNLKNCGTALRFLQVHIAKCYPGAPISLTGDPRLMERDGKPTTQTTSARILHGEPIPVTPNESPYITLSRRMASMYQPSLADSIESCWSSAAFWYEYVAIHGGELLLEGLQPDSLQGDRIVADLYARHFGVETEFVDCGAVIRSVSGPCLGLSAALPRSVFCQPKAVSIDFFNCPDLYPAVALTCEKLSIDLIATGTDRLRFKESDRLEAVRLHEVRNDHRMAMSLMAADYPVSIEEQACIAKSYPNFAPQHITPIRGVNDDNLGKKHALSKLINAATSEYVWLHDDDIVLPKSTQKAVLLDGDLIILPLRMESLFDKPSLLEKLQIAEYAAIQELTMRTAKAGHAVMCSGANLIVRREAWLACEPDLHPEIPSGDDMFLLEAMKKRGYKISVIDEPDFTAVVHPAPTWRAFFRQRMRWAGKAPKYTDPDILRCGAFIVAANLLQLLCPLILLIKFPIEYSLIRQREITNHKSQMTIVKSQMSNVKSQISNKEPRTPWYVALLLELLYPFYILFSLLGGLFRQKKW
ncbi:MAG: glycosyltransferase [Paludibacteraceae bacterium]|nr:glycosyltransferase [Paludibacteraceae bacterium]